MSAELIAKEAEIRRTFGIISHPDAGKTTLTEKLLLFGGAIQMAGTVKGRKVGRHATSDWMELEKERGISVTTSVMQFPYMGKIINLLDTPGHADFSEDTYRTLTAVDSALMVIDCAKGVEARTIKLMEVCRLRTTPIMTFINKLDREGQDPLDLLDEVESVLKIECAPITWPIGMGKGLKGIYHLLEDTITVYTASAGGALKEYEVFEGLDNPELDNLLGDYADEFREEVELVKGASNQFDLDRYLAGEQTPVFFGSALATFGMRELLKGFVEWAPSPLAREAEQRPVDPAEGKLTGFVFKVQANMDPQHRDRIAFMRICSGKFTQGMKVKHVRMGKQIKLPEALTFMASDRGATIEAYPGDIIGLHNHGTMSIGDTFTEGEELQFTGIPNFAPELFRRVVLRDPLKSKALLKGLIQLCEEGATQLFRPLRNNDLILGAVGMLQFDVVAHRLKDEYGVECSYDSIPTQTARWVECDDEKMLQKFRDKNYDQLAIDHGGSLVFLASSRVNLQLAEERFPEVTLAATREYKGVQLD